MDTRHTDVVHPIHLVAHDLGSDGGLFGDWQISGAGSSHDDDAAPWPWGARAGDCPGQCLKSDVGYFLPDRIEGASVSAGDEEAVAGCNDSLRDVRNLVGRLARTEHNLRKTLSESAVVVYACEPEILEWGLAQKLKKLAVGLLRCKALSLNVFEEGTELGAGHATEDLPLVDLGSSRTVRWPFMLRDGFFRL
jgi:hypothetical protein